MRPARTPPSSPASIWLRISDEQRRHEQRRPAPPAAQQLGRDEVDGALAPPGALHDERAAPLLDQRTDRLELIARKSASSPTACSRSRVASSTKAGSISNGVSLVWVVTCFLSLLGNGPSLPTGCDSPGCGCEHTFDSVPARRLRGAAGMDVNYDERKFTEFLLYVADHLREDRAGGTASSARSCSSPSSRTCGGRASRSRVPSTSGFRLAKRFQHAQALAGLGRQKAAEVKAVGGQTGDGQRRQQRGGPGDGFHAHVIVDGCPHQAVPGIGDQRRAGVRYQRHAGACQQPGGQFEAALPFVMFEITDYGLGDIKMIQQFAGMPGVFARDDVRLPQHPHRAEGHVLQIADRRRYQVERAAQRFSS